MHNWILPRKDSLSTMTEQRRDIFDHSGKTRGQKLKGGSFQFLIISCLTAFAFCQTTSAQTATPAPSTSPGETTAGATKPEDLRSLTAITLAVRARMEKDHRIRIGEEAFKGERKAHIYLYLSEQPLPYMVSLGWFSLKKQDAKSQPAPVPKKKSGDKTGIPVMRGLPVVGSMFGNNGTKATVQETADKTTELLNPITERNRSLLVVDELGLTLPYPGTSPQEKNFDKADWQEVIGFDQIALNNLHDAEKEFADAVKIAPLYARFNNNLGAMLAARGQYSAAAPYFDRAIREYENYAGAFTNRAFLSLAIGQPKLAIDDAKKALALDPTLLPARVAYARALMETGEEAESLKIGRELKSEAPGEWQSLLLLADVLLANKEYKEARTSLARLAVLSPGNPDIVLKLAHASEKAGDLDEAIKQGRKATQLAPNDARTHIALARYLDSNRDAAGSILQYERALDLKPERSLRKSAMGAILRMLIATERLPQADESSKKWVKQFPEDSECHFNRALIASQLTGDHSQECIDEYTQALHLEPSLNSAHYNLALVLIKAGKNSEALKELKSFIEASPDDTDSASAKELIRKLESSG
ncbi:MAG: tetratricopeptide repeat protein [Candidatus Obscuribacterales bacterium]|nr:tetratricopeptide repeat protein [Candidatus Obscuribacterales bacterium]